MKGTVDLAGSLLFFAILGISVVFDLRSKTVPTYLIGSAFVPGLAATFLDFPRLEIGKLIFLCIMLGVWILIPGIRKHIGGADLFLSLAGGLVMTVSAFIRGLFLAGAVCFPFAIVLRQKNRQATLPFVPFMFIGFSCAELIEVIICK